jgi:hypothetical protein
MISVQMRCLLVLLFSWVSPSFANTIVLTDDLLTPEHYAEAAEAIRHNMQFIPDRDLSSNRRDVVLRSLDRIERFMADDPDRHRFRIQMEQRRINTMLMPAVAKDTANAEVVCQRIKDVGSHIVRTQCRSRHEIELEKYAAQELLTRRTASCPPPCPQFGDKIRLPAD